MKDEQYVNPLQEARRLAKKELGLPKKAMTDLRKTLANTINPFIAIGRNEYEAADVILALFEDTIKDAERYVALATLSESVDWSFRRGNYIFRGCRYDSKARMDGEIDAYIREAKEAE